MKMYGDNPPPHTGGQHHTTALCWPLIGAMAYDLHYVIVLRVAIDHYHFKCLVGSTAYDFHIVPWLRICSQYSYTDTLVQCCVFVFACAFLIFDIQLLLPAFPLIKGQQSAVVWCCPPVWGGGLSPYIIISWCVMVFWGCILCLFLGYRF